MIPKISVIILTFNEEIHIKGCLSQFPWADEIIVVDSGSTDKTRDIAESMGAKVFHRPLNNFADQRNYAFSKAAGDWLFTIDADERLSDALIEEIREKIRVNDRTKVYVLSRINFFWGKRLRFSGARNDLTARLLPRDSAQYINPVHETIITDRMRVVLKNPLLHLGTRNLAHYLQKVACYVPLEVRHMMDRGVRRNLWSVLILPPLRFLYLYIAQLGFLDGWGGFQFAIMSSWYEFKKQKLFWHEKKNKPATRVEHKLNTCTNRQKPTSDKENQSCDA